MKKHGIKIIHEHNTISYKHLRNRLSDVALSQFHQHHDCPNHRSSR